MRINIINIVLYICILWGCKGGKSEIVNYAENGIISCSGHSFVQNEDLAEISAPYAGKILSVFAEAGSKVARGDRLAVIENADFLLTQQEYLEAKNLLEYYSQEYARQGDLTVENATPIKKMQAAKRDFQSADLRYQSFRKQLLLMGMNPDSLKPDRIRATLTVRSTENGIIAEKHVRNGSYVEKGEKLFDLTSKQSILLNLQIPEELFLLIKKDQKIEFYSVADSLDLYEATVLSVGSIIDPATHMASVIAKPMDENLRIIPGMSVKANIHTSYQKQ